MVIEIADPAVVRLLNTDPYKEESVVAAEVSEIPRAGKAATFAVRGKQKQKYDRGDNFAKTGGSTLKKLQTRIFMPSQN